MKAAPGSALGCAAAALAALPWLQPFAPGPSPTVIPWIAAAGCGLGLAILSLLAGARANARLLQLLAVPCAWAALATGLTPDLAMLVAALALVGLASCVPAGRGAIVQGVQWGWLAAAALSACMGLAQYFGASAALAPWVSLTAAGEAFGNLRQPNQFASLCWIGTAVLLFGTLPLRLPLRGALAVLLAVASAASASRTGLLHGVLLVALVAAWPAADRAARWRLAAAAGIAYALATLLLPVLLEAMGGTAQRSLWLRLAGAEGCSSRLVLWSNVLHLVALQPVTGWGWGELDYAHFLTLYPGERFCDILDNAHNLPLHLAVELGVPFALLACGGALAWALAQQPWREREPLRQLAWAALAILVVHSMLEYPLWYGPFQIAAGIALGWLVQRPEPAPEARPWPSLAPVLALAGALLYATWDYLRVSQIYIVPEQRLAIWREDALDHARRSWLFSQQAGFAELTLTGLTPANARSLHAAAESALHYSPEPRVIEKAIESATMLERYDDAVLHLARYRAAFPREYLAWREAQKRPLLLPQRAQPPT